MGQNAGLQPNKLIEQKQQMCCKGKTTEHCIDNQKWRENKKKELNINLFMKRIKGDQTRCLDIQRERKQGWWITEIFFKRSKQTTTINGKHSCYNKEFWNTLVTL